MKLTLKMLEDAKACYSQKNTFTKLFPSNSVDLTQELCIKHANMFDWGLMATALLSEEKAYEYAVTSRLMWKEFLVQKEFLWEGFREQIPTVFTDYAEEMTTLHDALEDKIELAVAEYFRRCALLFYRIATQEN